MTKNSKISLLEHTGEFEGKFGKMYTFSIQFENGDTGQINSTSLEPKFKIGDEIDYTITPSGNEKYPDRIKKVSTFSGGGGGNFNQSNPDRDARICRQNALTNAVNYFNANVNITNEIATPKDIITLAEEFSDWTCDSKKKELPF